MITTSRSLARRLSAPLAAGFVLGSCSLSPLPGGGGMPASDPAFRTRVYAGAMMGNSHLTPDTSDTPYSVEDSDDLGTRMTLGVDVHDTLAAELDTSVLGTASLRQSGNDVNYSAATLSALVYGLNGVQMRSMRQGWSAYGRIGVGILKKSSNATLLDDGGTGVVLGAGAEYGLANGLGIRGEITRFDDDAVYAGLGAVYRFGLTPRAVGGLLAEALEPALVSTETRVADGGRVLARPGRFGRDEPALGSANAAGASAHDRYDRDGARPAAASRALHPQSRWRPPALADDRDRDGVRDAHDLCPDTSNEVTVGVEGCGLFDTVFSEVVFESGSNWLTERARAELDDFADRLLVFPEARVRLLAHTDSAGTADANLALSARRAEVVVRYLQSRGVAGVQLEARGLGETRPLASNADATGRRRNRRVEVVTLANLDNHMMVRRDEPSRAPAVTSRSAGVPAVPLNSAAKTPAGKAVGTDDGDARPPGPWRPSGTPAFAAARPADKVARAVATLLGSPPEPLPTPARIEGFEIGGVIDGVGFVVGSAELEPAAHVPLGRIADELREHPEARIAVMAHTDDRGSEQNNLALSGRRAESVVEHLVGLGIERERLVAEGYGETLPRVQNVSEADRARNRRIEIRLLP